jgi:hypothetical protein
MSSNGHGGARLGAGRPKRSKSIAAKRDIRSLLEKYPIMPLGFMLEVVNSPNAPYKLRASMAKAAAPYIHARLSPIIFEDLVPPQYTIDVRMLDDDELRQFMHIQMKAQVRIREDEA